MTWGVFTLFHGVHSAPCTAAGRVLAPHTLEPLCECRPTPERQSDWGQTFWSHHDNH